MRWIISATVCYRMIGGWGGGGLANSSHPQTQSVCMTACLTFK